MSRLAAARYPTWNRGLTSPGIVEFLYVFLHLGHHVIAGSPRFRMGQVILPFPCLPFNLLRRVLLLDQGINLAKVCIAILLQFRYLAAQLGTLGLKLPDSILLGFDRLSMT